MNTEDVIDAIAKLKKYQSETDMIEVKTASKGKPEKYYDTLSAFANKRGGMIIFGVNQNKKFAVENVYDIDDLQKDIVAICKESMYPNIRPEILPIEYEDKKIVAIQIFETDQNKKPCYYKKAGIQKGSYIRVGDSDEHMTDYEIYALTSYNENIQEDLRPIKRACFEDLDKDKLSEYIEKVKNLKPNLSKFTEEKIMKLCGIIDTRA